MNKEFVSCEIFLLWQSSSQKNFLDLRTISSAKSSIWLNTARKTRHKLAKLAKRDFTTRLLFLLQHFCGELARFLDQTFSKKKNFRDYYFSKKFISKNSPIRHDLTTKLPLLQVLKICLASLANLASFCKFLASFWQVLASFLYEFSTLTSSNC